MYDKTHCNKKTNKTKHLFHFAHSFVNPKTLVGELTCDQHSFKWRQLEPEFPDSSRLISHCVCTSLLLGSPLCVSSPPLLSSSSLSPPSLLLLLHLPLPLLQLLLPSPPLSPSLFILSLLTLPISLPHHHLIPGGLSLCSQDSPASYLATDFVRQEAEWWSQLGLSREPERQGPSVLNCWTSSHRPRDAGWWRTGLSSGWGACRARCRRACLGGGSLEPSKELTLCPSWVPLSPGSWDSTSHGFWPQGPRIFIFNKPLSWVWYRESRLECSDIKNHGEKYSNLFLLFL